MKYYPFYLIRHHHWSRILGPLAYLLTPFAVASAWPYRHRIKGPPKAAAYTLAGFLAIAWLICSAILVQIIRSLLR